MTFTYDSAGNRHTMADGAGTTTWTYDTLYRPTQIAATFGTVSYGYDRLGLRLSLVYPSTKEADTAYDGLNRPNTITPVGSGSWAAGNTTYTYKAFGAPATAVRPNGITTTYGYDNAERLTDITHATGSQTLAEYAYTLDKVGNRTQVVETILQPNSSTSTVTITYTYDGLYRLTAADYSDNRYFHYTYDAVGNRLSETKCLVTSSCTPISTTYTYDVANRLTAVNSQSYTWDSNGNLTNDGTNTYTYDAANRLTSVTDGTTTSTYAYNGLGDRLSQTVNSTTTNYVLDLNAGLTQVLADGSNTYLYGNGRIGELQSGSWAYHLGDALGSVRQLADGSANVTLAREFEPYGKVLTSAGTGATTFAFTGEQLDASGMTYLRARYYNSTVGRFASQDTWEGDYSLSQSLNHWNYADSDPVDRVDPSGHTSSDCGIWNLLNPAYSLINPTGTFVNSSNSNSSKSLTSLLGGFVGQCPNSGSLFRRDPPPLPPGPQPEPPIAPPQPKTQLQCLEEEEESGDEVRVDFPDVERPNFKVLIVGEGDFSYTRALYVRHPDWDIVSSSYGNGSNSQDMVFSATSNLTILKNVDATQLGAGWYTKSHRFDSVVFNAPKATNGYRKESGDLVDAVLFSALDTLKFGGHVRFSATGGMWATSRLQQRSRDGYLSYTSVPRMKYFADINFGVPYQPMKNEGIPLEFDWNDYYWYIFKR